jgi:hypothetical protein
MSDNNTTKQDTQKREPFTVKVSEPYEFNPISGSKFFTSTEICEMVSGLLKNVFCDFEGCIFETNQGMEPTIALIFNHGEYENSNLPRACERFGSKQVGNTIIDRGRARDSYNRNGDRFFLTEDGQDFVKSLIIRRLYNNGNLNYKNIVTEIVDRGPMSQSFVTQYNQYTKVSFMSIDRLCSLIFPTKEDEGDKVEYSVSISAPINMGYGVSNYILNVTQISSKELSQFCNKIGVNMQSLNIIR